MTAPPPLDTPDDLALALASDRTEAQHDAALAALKADPERTRELVLDALARLTERWETLATMDEGDLPPGLEFDPEGPLLSIGWILAILAAELRLTDAWPWIDRLLRLPRPWRDDMWGDALTEELPGILWGVTDGDLDTLDEVARRPDFLVGTAAVLAIGYGALYDDLDRERAGELMGAYLITRPADEAQSWWTESTARWSAADWNDTIAWSLRELGVGPADRVRELYERQLISEGLIGRDEVLAALDRTGEPAETDPGLVSLVDGTAKTLASTRSWHARRHDPEVRAAFLAEMAEMERRAAAERAERTLARERNRRNRKRRKRKKQKKKKR